MLEHLLIKDLLEPLLDLANNNIPMFYHAGETAWMGMSTDENLLDSVLLNATRLGHGFALIKHPVAKRMVKEKTIAVEVCPISNQLFGLLGDLRNHPAATLAVEGFPLVVSADGAALWGVEGLSYDFYVAFMALAMPTADLTFLTQLAINSIMYSSLDDDTKAELLTLWSAKWEEFITVELNGGATQSLFFSQSNILTYTILAIIIINCLALIYNYL